MALLDLLNPYAYVMLVRRWAYRHGVLKSEHPGIPVISIGNLSMGGSGKSPLVMEVARHLLETRGKKVATISRGYRRRTKGFVLVRDGKRTLVDVAASGDEAQMFAELVPRAIVIVDEDRVHGARKAKSLGAEVVLLDDGYQHLRIQRDLNILLIDASRSLSAVIPLGRSREKLSAAHAADMIVFTHAEDKERVRAQWERLQPHVKQDVIMVALKSTADSLNDIESNATHALSELKGMKVLAVSSIASPRGFWKMLEEEGADVIARNLGDHAEYSESLVTTLLNDAERSGVDFLVTTHKDAVKSRPYFLKVGSALPVLVLSQKLEFLSGEQSFYDAIDRLL